MKSSPYLLAIVAILSFACNKPSNPDPTPIVSVQADSSSLSLSNIINSSDSFNLQSNGAWEISFSPSSQSWINVNAVTGTGNKKIVVKVLEANKTSSNRTVIMNIIPATGSTGLSVNISQTKDAVLAVNTIAPDHGPANTVVTITGTGFDPDATLDSVFFNGKAATVLSATSTIITAKVPIGSGTGNVSVKLENNIADGQLFTYELSTVAIIIAGGGYAGHTNGIGTNASFGTPTGLTVDTSGNIYVADLGNYTVRKITPRAAVTTFAGSPGIQGNLDGTGTNALLHYVNDVAADIAGNVYAADFDNNNIRKITPSGVVTTFITGVNSPTGIAVDAQDYVYIVSPQVTAVQKISPSGVMIQLGAAGGFSDLYDVALDNSGNMYVCDRATQMISKLTPSGAVTTIAGVWNVLGFDNGPGTIATFHNPSSIAVDNDGNIYVADVGNNAIRKINSSGVVSTYLANVSAYTTDASFFGVYGVAVDKNGVVYLTNTENNILKVTVQ
jgi:streptogramin lyase